MIKLVAVGEMLCTPFSAIVDEMYREYYNGDDPGLIFHYPEGDVDTIDVNNPNMEQLESCLYDHREMGLLPSDCSTVELPNGKLVNF